MKKERSLNEASLSLCYYYCLLGIFLLFFPKHLPTSQTRARVGDYRSNRTYLNPGAFLELFGTFQNFLEPLTTLFSSFRNRLYSVTFQSLQNLLKPSTIFQYPKMYQSKIYSGTMIPSKPYTVLGPFSMF